MSSVLHPVGPEPRERYWVRRVAVLVAAVVAIGVIIALVGNAMSAGSAVQAEPAPPSVVVPASASATPTSASSASPTPGTTSTPSAGGSPTPDASSSSTPTSTPADSDKRAAEKKAADKKAADKKAAEKKAAETKAADKKAAEKKAAEKKKAQVVSCAAGDVRTTLTGPRKVKTGKPVDFDLSVINGSSATCSLAVTSDDFTLTVVSGKDRVWSSDDCTKTVPEQRRKLGTQKSADWSMTWDGQRSAPGCKTRPEKPEAGYYWAIASYEGAKQVRWRIILT